MTTFIPDLVSWNVTARCGLRCPHCYIDASGKGRTGELTTEEGLALIDEIAALNPQAMLVLSGGEPLLRPDILDLARYAAGRGLAVVIGTNGVLLDRDMAAGLASSGVVGVGVSLDSARPDNHDAFRGMPGAWKRTVDGLVACREQGLGFQVQTTVTAANYDEIWDIMDLAIDLGAHVFNLFFLVCTGRGQRMTDIEPAQYEEMLRRLAATGGSYKGMMVRARCAPHFRRLAMEVDPKSAVLAEDGSRCMAATTYCRITPEGNVTPCPYMELSVGNVRSDGGFTRIWREAEVFMHMRDPALEGRCGRCEYRELCGGCRARAYATKGNYLEEDPWCTYEPGQGTAVAAKAEAAPLTWAPEAEERLSRAPAFARAMIRKKVESHVRGLGDTVVRPEHLAEIRSRGMSSGFGGPPPDILKRIKKTQP